jgi:uncharacterized protein (UPF0147 family)
MARKLPKLEVIFEYVEQKDSEQRLQQAFDMLFKGIAIDPEVLKNIRKPKGPSAKTNREGN